MKNLMTALFWALLLGSLTGCPGDFPDPPQGGSDTGVVADAQITPPSDSGVEEDGAAPDLGEPQTDAETPRPDGSPDQGPPACVHDAPCTTPNLGVCHVGLIRCLADGAFVCEQVERPAPERCDDADNDCDGNVDEDLEPFPAGNCGVGVCQRNGRQVCLNGQRVPECTPGEPESEDDGCDERDNDCDGDVDENCECDPDEFVPEEILCGEGICRAEGTVTCEGGFTNRSCTPGMPGEETCNSLDDDCDGRSDESFPGQGEAGCDSSLPGICAAGVLTGCEQCTANVSPGVQAETCNGLDDDCDGTIDESFPTLGQACNAGVGACRSNGINVCDPRGNGVVCNAQAGQPAAADATCNNIDDDCDGRSDENAAPIPESCGVGECRREVNRRCINGAYEAACQAGAPGEEVCDDLDNDCDGSVDDGVCGCTPDESRPCGENVGRCTPGVQVCLEDGTFGACSGAGQPIPEICNNEDDDCDGRSDEGIAASPTMCGTGACESAGQMVCQNGQLVADCQPGPAQPEICDGIDNNCNGNIDEGVFNACGACGPVPQEVCDQAGLDEDCDGTANEGCACANDTTRNCGSNVGACREGTQTCVNGAWAACVGGVTPRPEGAQCNNIDDNCDGTVDENLVNACGECGPAPAELCNAEDEDCDGTVDEDFNVGAPCQPPQGQCALGVPGSGACGENGEGLCQGCAASTVRAPAMACRSLVNGQVVAEFLPVSDGQGGTYWSRRIDFVAGTCVLVTNFDGAGRPTRGNQYANTECEGVPTNPWVWEYGGNPNLLRRILVQDNLGRTEFEWTFTYVNVNDRLPTTLRIRNGNGQVTLLQEFDYDSGGNLIRGRDILNPASPPSAYDHEGCGLHLQP